MHRALTLLWLVCGACSNAGPEALGFPGDSPREQQTVVETLTPPAPEVWLSPVNGSTNVSDTPFISISIRTVKPIERSVLEQLAAAGRLVTWPAKSVVETETSVGEGLVSRGIDPAIRLDPKQPLAVGWYALEVHSLVPPLRWAERDGIERDGESGRSRFKVGSEPVVVNIQLCEKAAGRTKLLLSLSEKVAVIQPLEDHLTVESATGALDCEVPDRSPEAGELAVVCDLAGIKSLKVTLSGAFAELNNPTLPAPGASAQWEFDPSTLPEITPGCKIYKPE